MRSQGTKATQGINGDARVLGAWMDTGATVRQPTGARSEPCPYAHHRRTDWVTPTSQVICGVCHPPASGLDVTRRGEPTFAELERAAWGRILPRRRRGGDPDLEASAQAELEQQHADELTPEERERIAVSLPTAAAALERNRTEIAKAYAIPPAFVDAELELDQALDAALEAGA